MRGDKPAGDVGVGCDKRLHVLTRYVLEAKGAGKDRVAVRTGDHQVASLTLGKDVSKVPLTVRSALLKDAVRVTCKAVGKSRWSLS